MMKLKSRLVLIETTDSTLPSGLVDKLTLDQPTPLRDSGNAAIQTAKSSVRASDEGGVTVAPAA